jgi:hypothetical protein
VTPGATLEITLKRRWQVAIAVGVPLFALLLVAGSAALLGGPSPGLVAILGVVFITATLGGLVVVPGVLLLGRYARGIPDVRLDERGIVWGRDRACEQSLDWAAIERVITKRIEGDMPERAFILRIRPDGSGSRATSVDGRILTSMNRLRYGTTFAISTLGADRSWEDIRAALGAHLPDRPFDLE